MPERLRLALIAHDEKKAEMVDFARAHGVALANCDIVATGTTGARILEACPGLNVRRLKSGPLGGDQQIGALIAEGAVDALIFLVDPLTPMPHDVDVKALMRLAIVYDLPMALNRASAEIIIASAARDGARATTPGTTDGQPKRL
jgi:methylglyoxal synthase